MLMVRGPTLTLVEEQFSKDKQKNNMQGKVYKGTEMSASVNDCSEDGSTAHL